MIKNMWNKNNRYLTFIFLLYTFIATAQIPSIYTLSGTIVDAKDHSALPYATVRIYQHKKRVGAVVSKQDGSYCLPALKGGAYELWVQYLGYKPQKISFLLLKNSHLTLRLSPAVNALQEVVVTASESKDLTTSSTIDRRAMQHIQPSSFTDLLALLPGNTAHTPHLTSGNAITLREVGISSSDYSVTSQGTQFVIDGAVQNQDANMQYVAQGFTPQDKYRNMVNEGVDMRSLSTDDIEKVEVIRGIPSVKYGDLTSGVIKITRRLHATPLEMRFKADEYSKLLHLNKGMAWGKANVIHLNLGYLDARADPRNPYESYQRFMYSARYGKTWNFHKDSLKWRISADFRHTIDAEKQDPEIEKQPVDYYKSTYAYYGLNHQLTWYKGGNSALKQVDLRASFSYSHDKIIRDKFVQLDRDRAVKCGTATGAHDAEILPMKYTAHLEVDGQPFTANIALSTLLKHTLVNTHHRWLLGADWKYSKNYGKGQVYNEKRPLNYTTSLRPRTYYSIPGKSLLSVYAEDRMSWQIGKSRFIASLGLRANSLLHLSRQYTMNGHWYIDPRVNVQWQLPSLSVASAPLHINLTAGWGKLTLLPSISQLYPHTGYYDFVELNYYHANPEYRRIHMMTYKHTSTPYDVHPSTNRKAELRLGLRYKHYQGSVTYFRERMNDGFRYMTTPTTFAYRKYDTSGIDASHLTSPPSLDGLPYENKNLVSGYSLLSNGSHVTKEGIEYQCSTRRFEAFNTRVTLNGAWLKSTYTNSRPVWDNSYTETVFNQAIRDLYIAHYNWRSGYIRERFNTNITIDTYLQKLGFIFSTTIECMWYNKNTSLAKDGTPFEYMDQSGTIHPYTEADKQDTYKRYLIQMQSITKDEVRREPFYAVVHLKASKTFGEFLQLSLFVDRILDYTPDYEENGVTMRRSTNPYFGMEIRCKF